MTRRRRGPDPEPCHRVLIEQPEGFEFAVAEIGRGWSKTNGPISFELDDTSFISVRAASSADPHVRPHARGDL
jgi:hypothetical protein